MPWVCNPSVDDGPEKGHGTKSVPWLPVFHLLGLAALVVEKVDVAVDAGVRAAHALSGREGCPQAGPPS